MRQTAYNELSEKISEADRLKDEAREAGNDELGDRLLQAMAAGEDVLMDLDETEAKLVRAIEEAQGEL